MILSLCVVRIQIDYALNHQKMSLHQGLHTVLESHSHSMTRHVFIFSHPLNIKLPNCLLHDHSMCITVCNGLALCSSPLCVTMAMLSTYLKCLRTITVNVKPLYDDLMTCFACKGTLYNLFFNHHNKNTLQVSSMK